MRCLITAIGSLSAETVISSLRNLAALRIAGTNSSPAEWVFCSTLVEEFHQVPPASEPGFIEHLLRICNEAGITHLFPLTDPEIDALSAARDDFKATGTTLCMSSKPAIDVCRDKWLMHETLAKASDVRVIPTMRLEDARKADYRLIAKPAKGRSSEGIVRINGPDELARYRNTFAGKDYIVQPYLEGSVYVVDIVRQKSSGRQASTCRCELTRTSNGAGITVQMQSYGALEAAAGRVALLLDLNGCVNMEFMVTDRAAYLMDINPRFSAGVGFSGLAGYDMVGNHLRCFTGGDIDPTPIVAPIIMTRRSVEVAMHIPLGG